MFTNRSGRVLSEMSATKEACDIRRVVAIVTIVASVRVQSCMKGPKVYTDALLSSPEAIQHMAPKSAV